MKIEVHNGKTCMRMWTSELVFENGPNARPKVKPVRGRPAMIDMTSPDSELSPYYLARRKQYYTNLKDELIALRDKYGNDRLTEIQDVADEIDIEDLIEEEQCVYTLTHGGYIKRTPVSEYRAQGRGGRGIRAMATKDEDYVSTVFTASTHDYILFFTTKGRVFIKKGYNIPEAGRSAKGTNIINIIPVEGGENPEKVSAMIRGRGMEEESYLFFVTRNGTVKRVEQTALRNIRSNGLRAITLDEGDELISVLPTTGHENIFIATRNGMAVCFEETDVRAMGRMAVGVRGIRLRDGDYVIGAGSSEQGGAVLTVTEKGYGKRTALEEYRNTRSRAAAASA